MRSLFLRMIVRPIPDLPTSHHLVSPLLIAKLERKTAMGSTMGMPVGHCPHYRDYWPRLRVAEVPSARRTTALRRHEDLRAGVQRCTVVDAAQAGGHPRKSHGLGAGPRPSRTGPIPGCQRCVQTAPGFGAQSRTVDGFITSQNFSGKAGLSPVSCPARRPTTGTARAEDLCG
jgi:hypothetical protein